MRIKKIANRGFTLVELMIVVAIVGVLAALAIYGVRKYVLNAKTAEARNSLGQMSKDAATAYSREGMKADVLDLKGTTGVIHRLCGSAAKKVPDGKDNIKGQKYQSNPSEWADGDKETGWSCLHFSMQDPQYYMYSYTASGTSGVANETFTAAAEGDLDADGDTSKFSIAGKIQGDKELVVTIAPNIEEDKPEE